MAFCKKIDQYNIFENSSIQMTTRILHTKKHTKQQQPPTKHTQEQQIFHKINQGFRIQSCKPSQHKKMALTIAEQLKRPQTSKNVKRDYSNLLNLLNFNKMIIDSRNRSIKSYNKIKCINNSEQCKVLYSPVQAQLKATKNNLRQKRYRKPDIEMFQNYMNSKQVHEDSDEGFLEKALLDGMFNMREIIPIQAKFHKKLSLFGEMLEDEKHKYVDQVKILLQKQREKGKQLTKNYQIYFINHYLITKLMNKMFSNSEEALKLKNNNTQLYSLIKKQMVGQIIKQQQFRNILTLMQKHEENQSKMVGFRDLEMNNQYKRTRNVSKTKDLARKKTRNNSEPSSEKISYGGAKENNDITNQFQKFYEMAQLKLADARLELNFSTNRQNHLLSFADFQPSY